MTPTGTASALPPAAAPLWQAPPPTEAFLVDALSDELSLPRALCAVLVARGIADADEAKRFLRPHLSHLHAPEVMPGLSTAVARLGLAVRDGETVLVHGDYDVDGVCATALFTLWLRRLGARVVPFVPHRGRDGYDFGRAGLEAARTAGVTLVVTADSGIQAIEAIAEAGAAGIDVIVTDHHAAGEALPDAVAVVNPNLPDSAYPDGLCGAGVAYRVCEALAAETGAPVEELQEHLDLVALATIADLVPLGGDNRTLARLGLRAIRQTTKPGLKALMERAEVGGRRVDTGDVGFRLAPRINAAGRMGEAMDALRLLLSEDAAEAASLAAKLDDLNRSRRDEERRTLDAVLDGLATSFAPDRDYGLVLSGEGWHPGVIGIVASRVVERVYRPTILIALDGDLGRGSGRSIPGFDLIRAVQACVGHLERFGGHPQAAGMDVTRSSVEALRAAFNAEARAGLEGKPLRPTVKPDVEIALSEATLELAHYLPYLGPFGVGNPAPLFVARGVQLVDRPKVVGSDHLRLSLKQGDGRLNGVGFGMAGRIAYDALGSGPLDVVFQLREDHFRGVARVDARFKDIRPADGA